MLQVVVEVASEQNALRVARAVTQYRVRRMLEERRERRLADLKVKLSRTLELVKERQSIEFPRAIFGERPQREDTVCHVHDFCDCFGDESVGARVDAMADMRLGDWSECFMSGALAL